MEIKKNNIEFKYDFNEIECIRNDIFPPNFNCCIIVKPGSGKTTLLRQIMLDPNLLFQKYEYIFIMSPSIEEYPFILNENNVTNKFDLNWIYSRLKGIKSITHVNVLLIIDDFIGQIHKQIYNPYLISLFYNRRHLVENGTLSIILTSQRYMQIPIQIRSTLNIIILFKLNFKDLEKIWIEHISLSKKQFISLALKDKFLICNLQDNKFFSEFDQVVFSQS